jgi:cysteine desulfurase
MIYLDHNATTPVDERVMAAMLPYFSQRYGNPSSRHQFGRQARLAVEEAREKVAASVGAQASQVLLLSGGSEANNLAIRGLAASLPPTQVVCGSVEHPCVASPCKDLAAQGWRLRKLAVDRDGVYDFHDLAESLREPTGLVSLMLANNETGAVQDIPAAAQMARSAGAWLHTDAVQALGKMKVDFPALGVHAMTLSGHKIYGPKGVGALVLDKRVELKPQVTGGGHERGMRAGTENVPSIVGFGVACELAAMRAETDAVRWLKLRERLESALASMGGVIFGQAARRLPNTSFFAFPDIEGETLLMALDRAGFYVASGSACSSSSTEPSAVLLAMGVEPGLARGAIRVSLGQSSQIEEVERFIQALPVEMSRLRAMLN